MSGSRVIGTGLQTGGRRRIEDVDALGTPAGRIEALGSIAAQRIAGLGAVCFADACPVRSLCHASPAYVSANANGKREGSDGARRTRDAGIARIIVCYASVQFWSWSGTFSLLPAGQLCPNCRKVRSLSRALLIPEVAAAAARLLKEMARPTS